MGSDSSRKLSAVHSRMGVFLLSAIPSCQECPLLSTRLPSTAHCCVWRTESTRSGTAVGCHSRVCPMWGSVLCHGLELQVGFAGKERCPCLHGPLSHSWCSGGSEPHYSWARPEHSCGSYSVTKIGFNGVFLGLVQGLWAAGMSSAVQVLHLLTGTKAARFQVQSSLLEQDVNPWLSVCFF